MPRRRKSIRAGAARRSNISRLGDKGVLRLLPADSVTEHSIDTPEGKLTYTATAGTLPLYNGSGEQSASIFYTAYVKKNAGANRPLTFAFNGGPGAASAFLHLGLVGPRILDLGPHARDAARAKMIDNPDTWLRFTDLVLIDPIGTGWSRTVKQDDAQAFWNVDGDAESMAKAVALYVARNNRDGAPKYLLGESYGGFRAAKVARKLQSEQGIVTAGLVMLSPLLEGWLTFGQDQSALNAALLLPTLAAAQLEREHAFTPEKLKAAQKFALGDYLTTLAGPPPQGAAGKAFYEKVAKVSGLPLDVVTQQRGFVNGGVVKNLRSGEGKIISIYDATFAVDDPFPEQRSSHQPDPILAGVARAYGGAFASYARNELGFKTPMTYKLLGQRRHPSLEMERQPLPCRRRRRPARAAQLRPVVPPADRAWIFRPGDAVRGEPIRHQPSAAAAAGRPRAAQALSRRAYALSRPGLAHGLQHGRGEVLSGGGERVSAHASPGT